MPPPTDRAARIWTAPDAMEHALSLHPECSHAEWDNGMRADFMLTYVIKLWRNLDCCLAGDPPRHIEEGYRAR